MDAFLIGLILTPVILLIVFSILGFIMTILGKLLSTEKKSAIPEFKIDPTTSEHKYIPLAGNYSPNKTNITSEVKNKMGESNTSWKVLSRDANSLMGKNTTSGQSVNKLRDKRTVPQDSGPTYTIEKTKYWGYVYLIKSGDHYKIGKTNNYNKRLGHLKIQLPNPIKHICSHETEDMDRLEKFYHSKFNHHRLNGEWFNLDYNEIEFFMNNGSPGINPTTIFK
jgi:hypothetical protein